MGARGRERANRAAALAAERGWLDPDRVDAVLRLHAAWGKDVIDCALEASWLTPPQAAELRGAVGAASEPAPVPNRVQEPRPGDHVGPYVLERKLGGGAMGTVYVGRHREAGVRHAVKLVAFHSHEPDAEEVLRFLREGEALARIDHPGVVRTHTRELLPGRLGLLAMDLVEGDSLEDWLRGGPLPIPAAVDLGKQLAEVLVEVHAAKLVHRDIKPENLLIRADTGALVLCDFGVARDLRAQRLTHTGQLLGSPSYMAPEQISGAKHAIRPATDVYGWGVTLYRALTNRVPFEATSLIELAGQVMTAAPTPPRTHRPELPPALEALLLDTLAKEPEERPTAQQVRERLETLDEVRAGVPGLKLAGGALALVAGVLGAVAATRGGEAPAPSASAASSRPAPTPAPRPVDPARAWARVETLPSWERYPAAKRWLAAHSEHGLARRVQARMREWCRAPLVDVEVERLARAFFLDAQRFVVWSGDLTVYDLAGRPGRTVPGRGHAGDAAIARDRSAVAAASYGPQGRVVVVDPALGVRCRIASPAQVVALAHDGSRVALGGKDGAVSIHATANGARLFRLPKEPHAIRAMTFTADGGLVVASGATATQSTIYGLTRWTREGERAWQHGLSVRLRSLLDLGDARVLMGSDPGGLTIRSLADGEEVARLRGGFTGFRSRAAHSGNVAGLVAVPARGWWLSSSAGNKSTLHERIPPNDLRVWDRESHALQHTFQPLRRDKYTCVDLHPGGELLLVTCAHRERAQVWQLDALIQEGR